MFYNPIRPLKMSASWWFPATEPAGPRLSSVWALVRSFRFTYVNVLNDHTGQEAAFEPLKNRTIVVRPTSLTSDAPTGKLVEFGDTVKGPSIHTDRADLAEWIANAIASGKDPCVVNLTGVKKQ